MISVDEFGCCSCFFDVVQRTIQSELPMLAINAYSRFTDVLYRKMIKYDIAIVNKYGGKP